MTTKRELKKEIINKLDIKSFFLDWLAPDELNLEDVDKNIIKIRT